jgi:hypothetical protein
MRTRILLLMLPIALFVGILAMTTSAQSDVAPRLTATLPPITNTPTDTNLTITWMRFTLDPEKSCFTSGMGLGLQVFFSNNGGADAGTFTLKATVNGQEFTEVIESLGAGESAYYWFENSGSSMDTVTAEIDALNVIAESDENDNILSQMLPIPTPYISCTPTGTPATSTPDGVTPTVTPTPTIDFTASMTALILTATANAITPTPTPMPGTVVSTNGGFEGDSIDGWKGKNLASGKQVCNKVNRPGKPDKIVAYTGTCAFQIKSTGAGKLVQTLKPPFAATGTTLFAAVAINPNAAALEKYNARVKVVYQDGEKETLPLPFTVENTGYAAASNSLPLTGEIAKIKLEVVAGANFRGRIYVDDFIITIE